jgi:eukaryotic-like serine/threonine-protein kinase
MRPNERKPLKRSFVEGKFIQNHCIAIMLRYFISREFLLTLIGLFVIGIGIYLLLFMLILPIYTRHGDSVLVPDISEVSLEKAISMLDEKGLRYEVEDSSYFANLPPLSVLNQQPPALSSVKPGRKVFLTVNQKMPPMVKIPDLKDLQFYQAKARLESWKLGVGQVTRVPDIAHNAVLEVNMGGKSVRAGTLVPQGTKIDLVVADAYSRARVEVPALVGLTYENAINEISMLSLVLGGVHYNPSGPLDQYGRVYSQNPKPDGDSVRVGYPIDLYIYGTEPETGEGVDVEVVQ